MSTAASAAPITISGLASGLNTSSIITQLVANESTVNNQLQSQVSTMQSQLAAWQTFNADLITLQSSSAALNTPSLYSSVQATSSDPTSATVTTQTGAVAGSHSLTVNTLASAQEVLSQSFTSATSNVGATGTISINGHQIAINSSQTLNDIATSINNSGAGVTATVLDVGTGDSRLSLTSNSTGTVNAIAASDISGNALETLGFVPSTSPTTTIRQLTASSGNSIAGSMAMSSSTAAVGTQIGFGATGAPSGSFTLGTGTSAVTVSGIDLNTMSLTDIANAINTQAGSSGFTAQVVASTSSGGSTTPQQLQIVSSSGTLTSADFTDPNSILSSLGVTQTGFTDQVNGAADASFSLDNVAYTRSSNTVSDALQDTTINLLSPNSSTTITTSQDTSAVTAAVQNFVSAYNAVNDYVNTQFTFTPNSTTSNSGSAQAAPALFGDQTLSNTQQQLADAIDVSTGGLSLQSVGLTVGQTGDLTLNTSTLSSAVSTNATGVANLFGQSGSATNSAVQYVGATSGTLPTVGGYAVNITQPATQAVITGSTPSAATLPASEKITFSGTLFPDGNVSIALNQGNTLAQTITQINNDNQLNSRLVASQDSSGDLVLSSTGYGSNQAFSVASSAGTGGTGIGTATLDGVGADVEGTINGELATGLGQTLIGNTGNANTDGLELNVTATTAGSYGTVTISNGVGDSLNELLNSVTNTSTGSITNAENAINTEITTDQTQEQTNSTNIASYQAQLETEFANMETAVSNLQAQGNAMNAEIAGNSTAAAATASTKTASTSTSSSSA